MTGRGGSIVAGVVALVGGFLLGRASVRAPADLERRIAAYEDSLATYRAARDSTLGEVVRLRERARADSTRSAGWEQRARAAEHRAASAGARADRFRQILAEATTAADSLAACMAALPAREEECAALREAAAALNSALGAERSRAGALTTAVDTLIHQVAEADRQLDRAHRLQAATLRAVRGCRVPVLGWRCPEAAATWDVRALEVLPRYVSVLYPVTGLLRVGVTWDRAPPD